MSTRQAPTGVYGATEERVHVQVWRSVSERSYGQYCGLARALDVVGDRWSLLIVRQLLVASCRYRDLRDGLPGIATNLLAQRLRHMEAHGVIERRVAPGRPGVVYALTEHGGQLQEVVEAFVRWSTPLMVTGPGNDQFRPEWLIVALRALLGHRPAVRPGRIELVVDGVSVYVTRQGATLTVGPEVGTEGVGTEGDSAIGARLSADASVVFGLVSGVLPIQSALALARFDGDSAVLAGVLGLPIT